MQNLIEIQELNKEIFNLFELLFTEAFGVITQKFCAMDNFGSKIREVAKDKINSIKKSFKKNIPEIQTFYKQKANKLYTLFKLISREVHCFITLTLLIKNDFSKTM